MIKKYINEIIKKYNDWLKQPSHIIETYGPHQWQYYDEKLVDNTNQMSSHEDLLVYYLVLGPSYAVEACDQMKFSTEFKNKFVKLLLNTHKRLDGSVEEMEMFLDDHVDERRALDIHRAMMCGKYKKNNTTIK